MKTPILLAALALGLGSLNSYTSSAAESPNATETANVEERISWRGCGITKKAFLKACAEKFTEATGVEVKVSGGGATRGIEAAGDGSADFGGTCRACLAVNKEDELGLRLSIVAWDALVPIVHPDNPVQSLTQEQVVAILEGRITDWKDVGGTAGPIEVLARMGKTSGVGYTTRVQIFGNAAANYTEKAELYKSSGPLEQRVEVRPNAVGITGVSSARQRKVKILAVDGVAASYDNLAAGKYPYYRPLYLTYKPKLEARQQEFLEFVLSADGQNVVRSQETVNLDDGWRLVMDYKHFEDVAQIDNYDPLLAIAKERAARESSK